MGRKSGSGISTERTFSDEPDWGFEYIGSGDSTVRFFKDNSNFDDLIDGMSSDQRDDFRSWAGGRFMNGQQYDGWDSMSYSDRKRTQTYDDILDQSTLSEGVVLSRLSTAELLFGPGHKTGTAEDFKSMEGQIIGCKGNMSFGAGKNGLSIGSSNKTVEYKLHIPGGTKGSGMWIGDKRINGWGPKQRESL